MKSAHLFNVADLAVIVTGAASGMGFAYAEAMADNGAKVTMIDSHSENPDIAVRPHHTNTEPCDC